MAANTRVELAEKMEIIGQIFEIDGMSELLNKYESGMSPVKFNAVTIQISGLLLKANKALADKVIIACTEVSDKEVQKMSDAEYAAALRNAIIVDIIGFFGSSPSTDGKK